MDIESTGRGCIVDTIMEAYTIEDELVDRGEKSSFRKGIILAGGFGRRLYPMTFSVSKQLMPVYDKPMIYFPVSLMMAIGIRDILIIVKNQDLDGFVHLLGDGSQWGIKISYAAQKFPDGIASAFSIGREFLSGAASCLMLGDNILVGDGLKECLIRCSERLDGACIFGAYTGEPGRYGVVEVDSAGSVLSLEEKPEVPRSSYAVPGIYFFDGKVCEKACNLKCSVRGEFEIIDLIKLYLEEKRLHVEILSRDIVWIDTGTPDSLADAVEFVRSTQSRSGVKVACPEELAYRSGFINRFQLGVIIEKYVGTSYGDYLGKL